MGQELKLVTHAAQKSLFYQPRGGCNPDSIGSNSSLLLAGWLKKDQLVGDGILIDLGCHPARWTPEGMSQSFPDIRDLLLPQSPAQLRAIFLTHGHNDHDEAILRYCEAGYKLPPIYAEASTLDHLRNKLRTGSVAQIDWPELREITAGEIIDTIQGFDGIEPVRMGHTRSGFGYLVKASGQSIFLSSDFKLDQTSLTAPTDVARLSLMGERGEVDLLCLDSTRATHEGFTVPEAQVRSNLLSLARDFPNHRLNIVVLGTSDEAIVRAGWLASQTGRFMIHHGSAVESALRILNNSGTPISQIVGDDDLQIFSGRAGIVQRLSPSHVLNVLAGANGEKMGSMARVSRCENDYLQLGAEDVVIVCAPLRSWNRSKIMGQLSAFREQGVEHIFLHSDEQPLDAIGHEYSDGLVATAELIKPKRAIVGLHGSIAQRSALCEKFAERADLSPAWRVDNGQTLSLSAQSINHVDVRGPELITALVRPCSHPPRLRTLEAA